MFKLLKILCGGCLVDLIEAGVGVVLSHLFFTMEVLAEEGLRQRPDGWNVVFDLSVAQILKMQALSGGGLGLEQEWMRYTFNKPFRFRFRFKKIERKYVAN